MLCLSRNDIEAFATRITDDFRKLPRFAGQKVNRIDPIILVCELCGLSIDHFHLSADGTILGMTAYSEVGVEVYDDEGDPVVYYLDGNSVLLERSLRDDPTQQGRYHFTLLHETSHLLLDRMQPRNPGTVKKRIIYYRGGIQCGRVLDWNEWQADTMASALLLPADIVWRALHEFDLGDGIDILNRVYRPREYDRFCRMADFLGSSKQALAIRLKRLGLLKKEYLRCPQKMLSVEKEDDEI